MKSTIQERWREVEVELQPSGGGVFEVFADGTLLYSKRQTGVFPESDRIIAEIRRRLA